MLKLENVLKTKEEHTLRIIYDIAIHSENNITLDLFCISKHVRKNLIVSFRLTDKMHCMLPNYLN